MQSSTSTIYTCARCLYVAIRMCSIISNSNSTDGLKWWCVCGVKWWWNMNRSSIRIEGIILFFFKFTCKITIKLMVTQGTCLPSELRLGATSRYTFLCRMNAPNTPSVMKHAQQQQISNGEINASTSFWNIGVGEINIASHDIVAREKTKRRTTTTKKGRRREVGDSIFAFLSPLSQRILLISRRCFLFFVFWFCCTIRHYGGSIDCHPFVFRCGWRAFVWRLTTTVGFESEAFSLIIIKFHVQ